jgi:hypothetical protein
MSVTPENYTGKDGQPIGRMRCKCCHYPLEHLTAHRCPECGREFDPNDPHTFELAGSRPNRHLWRCLPLILPSFHAIAVMLFSIARQPSGTCIVESFEDGLEIAILTPIVPLAFVWMLIGMVWQATIRLRRSCRG